MFASVFGLHAGHRNGYFGVLWPADAHLSEAKPEATIASLWSTIDRANTIHSNNSRSNTSHSSSLDCALTSCALQRLDTLHEQLLHLQYTCSFSIVTASAPADLNNTAEHAQAAGNHAAEPTHAPSADALQSADIQTADANVGDGPVVSPDLHSAGAVPAAKSGTDAMTAILQELQQLSDQVLQHACSSMQECPSTQDTPQLPHMLHSLKPHEITIQMPADAPDCTAVATSLWQQAAHMLPRLASYASAASLQAFMQAILQVAFCTSSRSRSSSPSGNSTGDVIAEAVASGQASDPASQLPATSQVSDAAAQAAAVLRQPRLWQEECIQQAWLHALQALLGQCCNEAYSAVPTAPESLHRKRRKGTAQHREQRPSLAMPLGNAVTSAPEDMHSVEKLLENTCVSVREHLRTSQASDSTHAPAAADNQADSKPQLVSASKKRKSVHTDGLHADATAQQQLPALSNIALLLDHAVAVTGRHGLDTIAHPLSLLMLQTQAWLVQQLLATSTQQPASAHSPTPAAESHTLSDRHLPQAPVALLRSLVSTQHILAQCLQACPDAVAAGLAPLLEILWQWLTAVSQLTQQLPSRINTTASQPATRHPATLHDHLPTKHSMPAASGDPANGINSSEVHCSVLQTQQHLFPAGVTDVRGFCEDMSAHIASCVASLACYSFGVRHSPASCPQGSSESSQPMWDGFLKFAAGVAAGLQVRTFHPRLHGPYNVLSWAGSCE